MNFPQPILLTGFTARMLAELAVRAGYSVLALDYFGDSDLQALCPSVSLLRDFAGKAYNPAALAEAATALDAPAVVYNASFENHPALVAQLANGFAPLSLLGEATLSMPSSLPSLMALEPSAVCTAPQLAVMELFGQSGHGRCPFTTA